MLLLSYPLENSTWSFILEKKKKWLLSLQMFVMIPCLKSACILFDLSLQHSHFFIQQNNPTYCMLFPNNLNIHTFSCHQKFIKEIWPKLTLQYIFLSTEDFKLQLLNQIQTLTSRLTWLDYMRIPSISRISFSIRSFHSLLR